MNIEREMDKIINALYDENLLQSNKVSTLNLMIFKSGKYKTKLTNNQLTLVLDILCENDYIRKIDTDLSKTTQLPYMHLTPKGIQIKMQGGLFKKTCMIKWKNGLIIYATFLSIIVGVITVYDFYMKNYSKEITKQITNYTKQNTKKENHINTKQSVNKIKN